jgi:hypothetical protein
MGAADAVAVTVDMVPALEGEAGEPCFAVGNAADQGV